MTPDILVRHRTASELHRLLKVISCDLGNGVVFLLSIVLHLGIVGLFTLLLLPSSANVGIDRLPDRQFGCPLTDLSEIGTREPVSALCQEDKVDPRGR